MTDQLDQMLDISVSLSDKTIIYPGDPTPEYSLIFSLASGGIANVGYLKHGIHHGTHVDVPCLADDFHIVQTPHLFAHHARRRENPQAGLAEGLHQRGVVEFPHHLRMDGVLVEPSAENAVRRGASVWDEQGRAVQ